MAEAGLFKGYEAALIIHPGGENEVGGTSLATHPLEITFHGRSCHIASLTDSGINALDCAVDLYQKIKELKKTFPKRGYCWGYLYRSWYGAERSNS